VARRGREKVVNVFVAGATGAVGMPIVRQLVMRGHEVVGLTRHEAKRAMLDGLGARAAVGDALDREALTDLIGRYHPEAVVHVLTALPKRGPFRLSELEATNVLRTRGTVNLLAGAVASGARRFVAESIVLVYGANRARSKPFTEDAPIVKSAALSGFQPSLDALRFLEEQVLGMSGEGEVEGVVLRYGFFYGPGVGSTEYAMKMLRRRMLPLPGRGKGVGSWVHVEDAASATVAAVERGRPGHVYNVVDDEPVSFREFMTALSRASGGPPPFSVPVWLARLVGGYAASLSAGGELRASNDKAKAELGWSLRYPTYREGVATMASVA
jgi:nucleoside-diphosphate-sugar epimerase